MFTSTTNVSQKVAQRSQKRKYTDNHYINVGFVGTVSAGKSTALNMIHSQTFEDMHIKRTTTALKIYKEDPYALISDVNIRKHNTKINVEGRQGKSKIDKMEYRVPKVQGIKSDKDALFAFYDFPFFVDKYRGFWGWVVPKMRRFFRYVFSCTLNLHVFYRANPVLCTRKKGTFRADASEL